MSNFQCRSECQIQNTLSKLRCWIFLVGCSIFNWYHLCDFYFAQSIAAKAQWGVMRNSEECQGVYFTDGTVMAAFFTRNANITREDEFALEASEPCLILIEDNRLYVSSFDGTAKKITIKWNNRTFNVVTTSYGEGTEAHTTDE
jgi:hypothetical protein